MIFSYGFLESDRIEAGQVLLNLVMPDDDPLGVAKNMICRDVPGIRVSTLHHTSQTSQQTFWDSPLVWWASVNEEDGLEIGLTQTTDGTRELESIWKGQRIESPCQLRDLLAAEPSWDIYQLRAVVLVLEQLETQLSLLEETDQALSNIHENEAFFNTLFRPEIFDLASRLRKMEAELLQKAVEDLMKQVSDLTGCTFAQSHRKKCLAVRWLNMVPEKQSAAVRDRHSLPDQRVPRERGGRLFMT